MDDPAHSAARQMAFRHAELLRRERTCLADLLLSIAEFDRRGLYRELGFASFFDYLHRELGMSKGMAHYRQVAARLMERFPEIVEPLRDGRLCTTTVIEVAKVVTEENRHEVLPRFFGLSRQEARQVAAELRPAEVVPKRTVVTGGGVGSTIELVLTHPERVTNGQVVAPLLAVRRTEIQPLTPKESRMHITVSPEFLALLKRAKAGQSHVQPGATDEQVLRAALELLIEKQGNRKASVPAKVKREVAKRDEGKCQWPVASGGVCGSEVRLEIDHVMPRGKGGPSTVSNTRVLCRSPERSPDFMT